MTSRGGSTISWYSYNQPNQINSDTNSTQFNYNANHQRWKQVAVDGTGTTTTLYVGGIMEKLTRPGGVIEYRHMIPAGSGMAIYRRKPDGTNSTTYVTTDHLGSGDLILDSAANVLARESFTPFGARRGSNWQGTPSSADYTTFSNTTRRGFTGHEMLDAVSLVNMNGRVYDPLIGRFLSADPIVQTINLSQALNPYSYVMNMPLTLTDPSGYSWLGKLFHSIGHFFKKFWRPILAIALAAITYGALSAYFGSMNAALLGSEAAVPMSISQTMIAMGAAGAVAGAVMGGFRGALTGAISGALFGAVAGYYGHAWNAWRVLANGAAGGASAELNGGSFRNGAVLSIALSAMQWGAIRMREAMIEQSKRNLLGLNASGTSDGVDGDEFKLGGARAKDSMRTLSDLKSLDSTPFGGAQGGPGYLKFLGHYAPGSWEDHLIEAYAGPHDWLSQLGYNSIGDAAAWTQTALGGPVFTVMSALALVPATVLVGCSYAPQLAFAGI